MAKPLAWKRGETADQYMTRSWASKQRRTTNRNLSRGGAVSVEGLEEFRRGLHNFEQHLDDILNEILKGPWGEELLEQVRAELSDHRVSGQTVKHLGIWEDASGVHVGHEKRAAWEKHPYHSRANFASIMRWLESGTRMHYIPTRVAPDNRIRVGRRVYSRVAHPGHKAYRPMKQSLRVFASDGERLVRDKLGERLEAQMSAAGAREGGVV